MAIVRSAGTEIIRCITLKEVDSTGRDMIVGEQHHIYTVLSIIIYTQGLNADRDHVGVYLAGYDANAGTSAENQTLFLQDMSLQETFVWNDKFSFNGAEPTGFTGGLTTAAEQDLIADQGTTTAQTLKIYTQHASDNVDVICTFIDQNNS